MSTDVKKSTGTATKKIVLVGVFGAISTVLMFLSFNVPFIPTFVKLDLFRLTGIVGGIYFRSSLWKFYRHYQDIIEFCL